MGLLSHQPGSDRPLGADHFVTVLASDEQGVTMHDPQGHPYAWLPRPTGGPQVIRRTAPPRPRSETWPRPAPPGWASRGSRCCRRCPCCPCASGARLQVDPASVLVRVPDAAVLDREARVLGDAQLTAVRRDGNALASASRDMADLHDELVTALARVVEVGAAKG